MGPLTLRKNPYCFSLSCMNSHSHRLLSFLFVLCECEWHPPPAFCTLSVGYSRSTLHLLPKQILAPIHQGLIATWVLGNVPLWKACYQLRVLVWAEGLALPAQKGEVHSLSCFWIDPLPIALGPEYRKWQSFCCSLNHLNLSHWHPLFLCTLKPSSWEAHHLPMSGKTLMFPSNPLHPASSKNFLSPVSFLGLHFAWMLAVEFASRVKWECTL